jgi:two-component system chemotaxis sensor kinase CheA
MTIDMKRFHASFFDESFEAIGSMEEALLRLAPGRPEQENIEAIFRVAHSIKGGAATFGFSALASLLHSLESLLDDLRFHRMLVTPAVIEVLLRSVDIVRDMLHAVRDDKTADAQRVADLQFDIERLLAFAAAAPPVVAPATAPAPAHAPTSVLPPAQSPPPFSDAARDGMLVGYWDIDFKPYLHLFARGNDPLRIFGELSELGELEAVPDESGLASFEIMDPENCYLSWRLTLRSDAPREAVAQAFDWAEGDCQLTITRVERPGAGIITDLQLAPDAAAGVGDRLAPSRDPIASAAQAARAAAATAAQPRPAAEPRQVQAISPGTQQAAPGGASGGGGGGAAGGGGGGGHDARVETATIRVGIDKVDELINSVGELVITRSMLAQIGSLVTGPIGKRLRAGLAQLERSVRELQDNVLAVRMVPVSFVFSRFPRMVRDLSLRLGKQVELRITGEMTEIDKTLLEKVADPLVHLLRNALDHGIEAPDVRRAAGKPESAVLRLHAQNKGGCVVIEVEDDGGGLDRDAIVASARRKGLVDADAELSPEQIDRLIFVPGFSTSAEATDISGRGVGMDVVRRNIDQVGGSIAIDTLRGSGTRFTITLPLTLAIVDGQTVSVGSEQYIVPVMAILVTLQVAPGTVQQIAGRGDVLEFRGGFIPVIDLEEDFGRDAGSSGSESGLIMVVEGEGRAFGLRVDALQGQQQVVVKALDTNYQSVRGIAGGTILADGSVALILDVAALARDRRATVAA